MRINIDYAELDDLLVKYQETQENKLTRNDVKFLKNVLWTIAELNNNAQSKVHFMLDGCDISFGAEAPVDMTLAELLKQCDRITPDWCACGIRSYNPERDYSRVELSFDYDDVKKVDDPVSCTIRPKEGT